MNFMDFKDISDFKNTADYLPILNGAIITDLFVILSVALGQIKSVSLTSWYKKYGTAGFLADVLSLVIGVIITRFLYSIFFSKFSMVFFLGLVVVVQFTHDILFSQFFNAIPRGKSEILDTFKDYAKEFGPVILLADATMMLSTVLHGSLFASLSVNTNIIILIVSLYIMPYLLYSIK